MFESLEQLPVDPIFRLFAEYLSDKNPAKVNLGIGLYADGEGRPFVMPVVKKAFEEVDRDNFNYQPIGGNEEFLKLSAGLVFGELFDSERLAMQATCGGTQAVSIFSEMVLRAYGRRKFLVSVPTWGNYFAIFRDHEVITFEHLDEQGGVNFEAHKRAIEETENGSVLILQGALPHNPTGLNLSLDQIESLIPLINEKEILVFMDMAYLGLGEGLVADREYAKLCLKGLNNFALGLSFSKNASLYEQRTGAIFVKAEDEDTSLRRSVDSDDSTSLRSRLQSQMQRIARETISMAPGIGQEMMINVLANHRVQWEKELEEMRMSIESRKLELIKGLPQSFESLKETRGMFGLLKLSKEQILRLKNESAIYVLENGRMNFSGIKVADIDYIARGIAGL